MKKILLSLAALVIVLSSYAQLPSGSICPDFSGTDLDGNQWNLYDLLDQGYRVVIDVSATWCGPCWGYHTGGALETLWEEHGPDGTNEVMVFFVEGDAATTLDDLNGTGGSTQGDWVTGTGYPIIDDADIANLLEITYFPTIYTVCPSRIITETGQISAADHYGFAMQNACSPATEPNDPSLVSYNGAVTTCSNVEVVVTLQNFGLTPLTACTIEVTGGDNSLSYNWTGNLDTYELEEVTVGVVNLSSDSDLNIGISSANDLEENDEVVAAITLAEEGTTHIRVELKTDNWPTEISWELRDDNGNVVEEDSYGNADNTEQFTYDFWVAQGCYTFVLMDEYGDGMNASYWGDYEDGNCYVYSLDDDGNTASEIFSYDGSVWYAEAIAAANAAEVVGVSETEMIEVLNAFPNPTDGLVNFNYTVKTPAVVSFEVIDMVGARVMFNQLGNRAAGNYTQVMDFASLAAGMYMVNIMADGQVNTLRINVH